MLRCTLLRWCLGGAGDVPSHSGWLGLSLFIFSCPYPKRIISERSQPHLPSIAFTCTPLALSLWSTQAKHICTYISNQCGLLISCWSNLETKACLIPPKAWSSSLPNKTIFHGFCFWSSVVAVEQLNLVSTLEHASCLCLFRRIDEPCSYTAEMAAPTPWTTLSWQRESVFGAAGNLRVVLDLLKTETEENRTSLSS